MSIVASIKDKKMEERPFLPCRLVVSGESVWDSLNGLDC